MRAGSPWLVQQWLRWHFPCGAGAGSVRMVRLSENVIRVHRPAGYRGKPRLVHVNFTPKRREYLSPPVQANGICGEEKEIGSRSMRRRSIFLILFCLVSFGGTGATH